jgi:hypothetical protein
MQTLRFDWPTERGLSVKSMRELASFLTSCADEMNAQKKPYGPDTHFHLRDFLKYEIDADLIVVPVRERT